MSNPLLVVAGHATSTSIKLLVVADHTASFANVSWNAAGLTGYEVLALRSAAPWRLEVLELTNLPSGAAVTYRVVIGDTPDVDSTATADTPYTATVKLLPTDRPLRIGFVSCNGFYQVEEYERRYLLWRELKVAVEKGEIDLLIHGGDQVYADPIWMNCDSSVKKSALSPRNSDDIESVAERYRRWYVEKAWADLAVRQVLASVPNLMMWDDHDIFDGWGSNDSDTSPSSMVFFRAADAAFSDFQRAHGPAPLRGGSHLSAMTHGDTAILIPDLRSNRHWHKGVVIGERQLDAMDKWLEEHVTDNIRHLFVVLSIPLVHARVAGALRLLEIIPGTQSNEDDLRDCWTSSRNRAECEAFCKRMFSILRERPHLQITMLSGDVHVGAMAEIVSQLPIDQTGGARRIMQVTSSGIGHPPPTGCDMWLIRCALASMWMDLGSADFRGRLIPLNGVKGAVLEARNFVIVNQEGDNEQRNKYGNLYVSFVAEKSTGKGAQRWPQVLNGPGEQGNRTITTA